LVNHQFYDQLEPTGDFIHFCGAEYNGVYISISCWTSWKFLNVVVNALANVFKIRLRAFAAS